MKMRGVIALILSTGSLALAPPSAVRSVRSSTRAVPRTRLSVIERQTTEELSVFGAEEDDDVCMVLPRMAFEGEVPEGLITYGGTPLQLEENEDDTSTLSAVQLFADGSVALGDTDGPIATSACGLWNAGGKDFQMTLRRTFPISADAPDTYSVTRVFTGEYDEMTKSYQGKIELAQTAFQNPTDDDGPFEWKYTYIGCERAAGRPCPGSPFDAHVSQVLHSDDHRCGCVSACGVGFDTSSRAIARWTPRVRSSRKIGAERPVMARS